MNPAFEKRYLAQFNSFERDIRQMTGDPFLTEGATAIREFALAETRRLKLNDPLQVDGLYFIVLMLFDFVYRPAFATPDVKPQLEQVLQSIQQDITFILTKASELKRKQEITLKDVLQIVMAHYSELKSLAVTNTSTTSDNVSFRR